MNFSPEVILATLGNVIAFGVFIGVMKSSQAHTREMLERIESRLERIEDKEDKKNEEMAELRERVAVIESIVRQKQTTI